MKGKKAVLFALCWCDPKKMLSNINEAKTMFTNA